MKAIHAKMGEKKEGKKERFEKKFSEKAEASIRSIPSFLKRKSK